MPGHARLIVGVGGTCYNLPKSQIAAGESRRGMDTRHKPADSKSARSHVEAPHLEATDSGQLIPTANAAIIGASARPAAPPPLNPRDIMALQGALGNRAINRLLAQRSEAPLDAPPPQRDGAVALAVHAAQPSPADAQNLAPSGGAPDEWEERNATPAILPPLLKRNAKPSVREPDIHPQLIISRTGDALPSYDARGAIADAPHGSAVAPSGFAQRHPGSEEFKRNHRVQQHTQAEDQREHRRLEKPRPELPTSKKRKRAAAAAAPAAVAAVPTAVAAAAPSPRKPQPKAKNAAGRANVKKQKTVPAAAMASAAAAAPTAASNNQAAPKPLPAAPVPTAAPAAATGSSGSAAAGESKGMSLAERLKRSQQRGLAGNRRHKGESGQIHSAITASAIDWTKNKITIESTDIRAGNNTIPAGPGPWKASKGQGEQPRISTKAPDFNNKVVGTDYVDMMKKLVPAGTSDAAVAQELLDYLDTGIWKGVAIQSDTQRRAAAFFLGITHFAEEQRTAGTAKMARAALRMAAQGESTLAKAFSATVFVAAAKGGTANQRELVDGTKKPSAETEALAKYLSDSSDEDQPGPESADASAHQPAAPIAAGSGASPARGEQQSPAPAASGRSTSLPTAPLAKESNLQAAAAQEWKAGDQFQIDAGPSSGRYRLTKDHRAGQPLGKDGYTWQALPPAAGASSAATSPALAQETTKSGNCLYEGVSIALGHGTTMVETYRQLSTSFFLHNPNIARDAGLTVDGVIDVLSRTGAWVGNAGDLSPVILATVIQRKIVVVTAQYRHEITPMGMGNVAGEITLYLHDSHYTVAPPTPAHRAVSIIKKLDIPLKSGNKLNIPAEKERPEQARSGLAAQSRVSATAAAPTYPSPYAPAPIPAAPVAKQTQAQASSGAAVSPATAAANNAVGTDGQQKADAPPLTAAAAASGALSGMPAVAPSAQRPLPKHAPAAPQHAAKALGEAELVARINATLGKYPRLQDFLPQNDVRIAKEVRLNNGTKLIRLLALLAISPGDIVTAKTKTIADLYISYNIE